jgi:hypothetical protein
MKRVYLALFAFVVGLAIVHAIVGFWTPVQGDDWNHWIWAGRHRGEDAGTWFASFVSSHFTFSDAVSYLLARCRLVHVVLTPTVVVALVVGLFVLAMRRLPRATWQDVSGLVLSSALLWIAQPSAGVTLFHTANVGLYLYGTAIAVLFFAPFRCGWQVPRWMWPLMVFAGYCVGTSTRAIATASLVGVIVMFVKKRERWMAVALGGLLLGTIAGYINPPWLELGRVLRRGFEQNLTGPGLLKFLVEEGGEVVSLVAALTLVDAALGRLGRGRADSETRPEPTDSLRWFGVWLAIAVWCLFGPHYNEATLLPASCVLVVAALPHLLWLTSSRDLRVLINVFAVGVHLIVWPMAIAKYHRIGAEGMARMAIIEGAPPGGHAVITPYSQIPADFWFLGEDLGIARQRQLVAIESFGLRDIAFDRDFRRLDLDPGLEFALDVDGVSEADLRAAHVPPIWASELTAARKQFELFVKRLHAVTGKRVSARLRVTNVTFQGRRDRPLLAAWSDAKGTMVPRTQRSSIDPNAQITVRIYRPESREFKEAWMIDDGVAQQIDYRGGSLVFRPQRSALDVAIACNPERCLAVDAFIARF